MGGRIMGRSGKGGAVLSVIDSPVTNHGVSNYVFSHTSIL
jgi:hypothetical protein